MAKIVSFGIQKGGAAKTTSSGIVAHLLSKHNKVLAVDLDSQGNLTELLTQQDIYDFHGRTVFEALKEQDARPYIHSVTDTLDIITAEDHLATFPRHLYTHHRGNKSLVLKETLETVKDDYDYIIIDTPPALGDQTVNALAASDAVVIMFETSKFCYSALGRFIETVGHCKEMVNPDLKIAGILRTIVDTRRSDAKAFVELIDEGFPGMAFKTVITRKAATGRLTIHGFKDNPELKQALEQYEEFVKELIARV